MFLLIKSPYFFRSTVCVVEEVNSTLICFVTAVLFAFGLSTKVDQWFQVNLSIDFHDEIDQTILKNTSRRSNLVVRKRKRISSSIQDHVTKAKL